MSESARRRSLDQALDWLAREIRRCEREGASEAAAMLKVLGTELHRGRVGRKQAEEVAAPLVAAIRQYAPGEGGKPWFAMSKDDAIARLAAALDSYTQLRLDSVRGSP